jgi:hypothetical protein
VTFWQLVAALGPVLGAAIRGSDRRIERALRHAQALSPDRATSIAYRSPIIRWRLARLRNAGVVRPVDERYYWHEDSWREYRRARRRRALAVFAVLVVFLTFLWWRGALAQAGH